MLSILTIINYIVNNSAQLKNKFTDEISAPIEFACIFCQDEKEYNDFTNAIESLGKVVEETPTGFTYLLTSPIETIAGPLRLVKIRKPDFRKERGDADFNTSYVRLKKKYSNNPNFELVRYETFEMLRLSDPNFDVMVCFSNIPKSKNLGIKL